MKGFIMQKFISDKVQENSTCGHVFILYHDGEIVMTKGGSCFLARSMFQQYSPVTHETVPVQLTDLFDNESSGFKCMYSNDITKEMLEYRELLKKTMEVLS